MDWFSGEPRMAAADFDMYGMAAPLLPPTNRVLPGRALRTMAGDGGALCPGDPVEVDGVVCTVTGETVPRGRLLPGAPCGTLSVETPDRREERLPVEATAGGPICWGAIACL